MSLTRNVKKITLWKVAIPNLVMVLISTISSPINVFISSGVNKTAVEAVGTAGGLMMLFGVLLSLLTGGASIVTSQYIGSKKSEDKLKKATDSPFLISLIEGFIVAIILLSLNHVLLKAWGLKEGTQQFKDASLYIYSLASTFIIIGIGNYFIGMIAVFGNPKWATIIGMSQIFLNILLSFIFVRVIEMGILGLIVATIIVRVLALSFSIFIYSIKVQRFWKIRHFDWFITKKIIGISLPIAGEKINYNIGTFVKGIIIGWVAISINLTDKDHNYMILSNSIFNSIQAITLIGSVAFSIAVENVVARLLGNKEFEESKKTVARAFIYALLLDIPITIIVFFLQGYIIDWVTENQTQHSVDILKKELKWSFLVLIALEIGRAANLIYIAAARSAGDSKFTAFVSIPVTWIFAILLGWILSMYAHMGWLGIVVAAAVDECIRGIVNYLRWKSGKWMNYLEKLHRDEEVNEGLNPTIANELEKANIEEDILNIQV